MPACVLHEKSAGGAWIEAGQWENVVMPVYTFECLKCGHQFDETLSVTEYEKKEAEGFSCPKCGSQEVDQLVLGCTVQTSKKS